MTTNTGQNIMNFADYFQDKANDAAHKAAHNLAWMNTKLCAPLVIKGLMDHNDALDDESIYALHDMISDFEIDAALLAIASGALQIIRAEGAAFPAAHILGMECERIICAYGEEWTAQNRNGETNHDYLLSILRDIPEEFESLCDLLQLAMDELDDSKAKELLEVLEIQAGAQLAVADEFVEIMNMNDSEPAEETLQTQIIASAPTMQQSSNVIAFPGL